MAENKTEQPTEKRLRDARKKGEVFKSADLTHAFLFLAVAAVLALGGAVFIEQWKASAIEIFSFRTITASLDNGPLLGRTDAYFMKFFVLLMPLLGTLLLIALSANFLQVRGLFATEVLAFRFERMNPVAGLRRIFFESRSYIEFAKTLVKLIVILWLAYLVLRGMFPEIMLSGRLSLDRIGVLGSHAVFILLFAIGGTFLLLGGADYLLQRRLYMKKMMMTKEEVKREHKQEEGDPQIRSWRRQIHREILTQNIVERVPQATALIMNPTHLAVALRYDEKTMEAPEVTAKGQEQLAEEMIKLAKDHGVPVVRDVSLAHSLFRIDVDTQIPEELYGAVAEILTWVYDLTRRDAL
ncbi:MAG TPA: EscU/YscU/HrcU family type III secretion system export apparatus switch protein [Bryobacteraceae bacterium]|jgi:type III secretion YscU/HrpY family protein|nr:EscU/YscU/HrcU family type III secretion system export apparatus switch protein [Bryobacteraceae bacterium]